MSLVARSKLWPEIKYGRCSAKDVAWRGSDVACLHDQNKSGFVESRLLSSQSDQFKKYSKSSDWLKKAGPLKSHFCFDHVHRLMMSNAKNVS